MMNKISLPKIDVTQNQKKIIIAGASGLFILLFFWIFFFMPANRQISLLKSELISTQQQIQAIEILLSGAQGRDEAIRLLKERQQYLSNKFPQKEEESLRLITDVARKMNITVISLQPGARIELLDAAGKQMVIEGKVVKYLPISLEVSCYFRELVKYALELKLSLPAFTSVNRLDISKEGQVNGKILANLEFDLFLLE